MFLVLIQWITSFCCYASDLSNIKVLQFRFALLCHSLWFWTDDNVAFQRQKTSARKLHSPTVSLHSMQCFIIAYARVLECFVYFLFSELHNIDTVIWFIHYKRFSVIFGFISCFWLHSLLFWMDEWQCYFSEAVKPARKLCTQTVSCTLGFKKYQFLKTEILYPDLFTLLRGITW